MPLHKEFIKEHNATNRMKIHEDIVMHAFCKQGSQVKKNYKMHFHEDIS